MLGLVPQLEMRGSYSLLFQMLILPNGEEICMACKLYSYVLVFQIMFRENHLPDGHKTIY